MFSDMIQDALCRYSKRVIFESGINKKTYADASIKINKISESLRLMGISKGNVVCCILEKNIDGFLIMLSLMNIGAIYFPVDDKKRINLDEKVLSAISLIIVKDNLEIYLEGEPTFKAIVTISDLNSGKITPALARKKIFAEDILYFIKTSGTTGNSKVIKFRAKAMSNLINWSLSEYPEIYHESARHIISTPLNFDVSLQEMLCCFFSGGQLILPKNHRNDFDLFFNEILDIPAETLYLTPSILNSLSIFVEVNWLNRKLHLKTIIAAGEELILTEEIKKFITNYNVRVLNQYGPSETHVVSSFAITRNLVDEVDRVSIGFPITNCSFALIDVNNNSLLTTPNSIGELLISGANLFQGYLNDSELTFSKFKMINLDGVERNYYRTGDLCSFDQRGYYFHGRCNDDIKFNGSFLNTSDLEMCLKKALSKYIESVFIIKKTKNYTDILVAFYKNKDFIEEKSLLEKINAVTPAGVIISEIYKIDKIPLTTNGKIDKKFLSRIAEDVNSTFVADREYLHTLTEKNYIIGSWEIVLQRNIPDFDESFTNYGGNSLSFINLYSLLKLRFPELKIGELYMHNTINKQLRFILCPSFDSQLSGEGESKINNSGKETLPHRKNLILKRRLSK